MSDANLLHILRHSVPFCGDVALGLFLVLKDVLNILKCAVTTASQSALGGRSVAPLGTGINFLVLFLSVSGYWGKKS